jgi:hypothetical protein
LPESCNYCFLEERFELCGKNFWMKDPFAFENPEMIMEFYLTLEEEMNGNKLVLHSH